MVYVPKTPLNPIKPPFSYGFPMVFLWFSYGFPMVFLWFSYGFPMVFLWFSYGFPMVFLWFSYGFMINHQSEYPRSHQVSASPRARLLRCDGMIRHCRQQRGTVASAVRKRRQRGWAKWGDSRNVWGYYIIIQIIYICILCIYIYIISEKSLVTTHFSNRP